MSETAISMINSASTVVSAIVSLVSVYLVMKQIKVYIQQTEIFSEQTKERKKDSIISEIKDIQKELAIYFPTQIPSDYVIPQELFVGIRDILAQRIEYLLQYKYVKEYIELVAMIKETDNKLEKALDHESLQRNHLILISHESQNLNLLLFKLSCELRK